MQQNSEVPCASDLLQRALKNFNLVSRLFVGTTPPTHSHPVCLSVLTSTAAPQKNGGRRGGQKHNSPEKKFPDSVVGFYFLLAPLVPSCVLVNCALGESGHVVS